MVMVVTPLMLDENWRPCGHSWNEDTNSKSKVLEEENQWEDEISKLIKAFPKDIAALDKRSVLVKVNSQGSGI